MKSLLKYVAAIALCVGLYVPGALALDAVPHSINIQGVLRNVGGEVVTGTYSVRFAVYDAVTGGNVLCQNIASLSVVGGVFNTAVTCPSTAFVNKTNAYLGITVGSDAELSRVALTSVGYAIQAEHAEQADELLGAATDVNCLGCIGATEVSFNYAASDRQGGPATDVNCSGCVSGGAPGDIAAGSITTNNIGALEVKTGNIDNGAVTNAKLATDSVYTGNILDGQVTTPDLANGAVTSGKIGTGAVGDTQIGVNYALGTSKGGPAADLNCTVAGCVSDAEAGFNYALGKTKGGAAAGLDCLASPCVEAGEVTFTYAASATKNGPASDVACTDCIGAGEVQFNYAASATENGEASGLACTGCVGDTDLGVNYAASTSKGGDATGLACSGACVSTGEVDFNWAASATKGGPANGLVCTGCVQSEDVEDGSIVNADISGPVTGSKITTASATDLGVVKIGQGLLISNGSVTPDYAYVAQKNHDHGDQYFEQSLDNLLIGDGKYIDFIDPGDNPGSNYARLSEVTAGGDGNAALRLTLGQAAAGSGSYFEVYGVGTYTGTRARIYANGNAYFAGGVQVDGTLTCGVNGCVDSADIVNGAVTSADIEDGSSTDASKGIQGSDLSSALQLTTSGKVTANEVWAKRFVDSDESGAYYMDPNGTSIVKDIQFNNLYLRGATQYGIKSASGGISVYTKTVDAGATGEILGIAKNVCGQVEVWNAGGGCANNTMTVHGTFIAKNLYDEDGTAYYVDPASHSRVNTFETATSKLPATGTTTNYIDGTTYAFNGRWYDTNATGYWVDPHDVSVFNVIQANGFRTNTWPGDPAGGNGQVAGNGSDLYLNPPPNGAGDIYFRNEGVNKIAFALEGNSRTALPSFRTNGNYLVINPGTGDPNLYFNLDVGGANRLYGTTYANNLVDIGSETCIVDGGGTTTQNSIYSAYHSAYYSHIFSALRVDGTGIFVVGDGGWNTGIRMNGNTSVIPTGDAQGAVGMSSRRFAFMYSVNSVWTSERKAKKDIRYLGRNDMDAIGKAIQSLKPATWLYNQETDATQVTKETDTMMVRNVPHIGLILDEMPAIITNGGQGWYANDSVGFLLVASKYLDDKINRQADQIRDLEDRLAVLEQAVVDAGLYK